MDMTTLTDPILKGSPQSLAVLDHGYFRVHSGPRDVGIQGFLVQTDAEEVVLIDTGFPAKYAVDFEQASAEDDLGAFGEVLSLTHENLPGAQLAKLGLTETDVTHVIITHTHIDHVGGIGFAPHAPMVIAEAERSLPKPLYWGDRQPLDWPDRSYLLIEDDVPLGPGFEIMFTPGHAPGELAIWLELPQTGPVLMTSDAISRPAELDERFAGSWDEDLALHHAKRILRRAENAAAMVIYGHCPEQWHTLKKAPERFF